MHDFKRLQVWQRSRELAIAVCELTKQLPPEDRAVIGSQLRRAALSIPANIAEGCGKSSRRETLRFWEIASGSAKETESHILIATDLGYLPRTQCEDLSGNVQIIQRMLARLIGRLPS
jgi:four helix bundle protein